jgi:hypothetical protein
LDEILLAIESNLYSFALRFLFLQTHATSYSFCSALLYTLKEKGGKPDRKTQPLTRNPYRSSSLRSLKIVPRKSSKKLYVLYDIHMDKLDELLADWIGKSVKEDTLYTLGDGELGVQNTDVKNLITGHDWLDIISIITSH